MAERLGILGGTFDPPHRAHLAVAQAARDQFGLDRVLLVVAGDPWQKREEVEAAPEDRLAMVEALVAGHEGLEVADIEVRRRGPTYTVDTLTVLSAPGRELFLILGADAAAGLHTWRDPQRLRALATVLVAPRSEAPDAGEVVEELRRGGWRAEALVMEAVDVSSSEVRRRLHAGETVDGIVPDPVVRVVRSRRLYTPPA